MGHSQSPPKKKEMVLPNVKIKRLSRKLRDNNVTDQMIKWKQGKRDVSKRLITKGQLMLEFTFKNKLPITSNTSDSKTGSVELKRRKEETNVLRKQLRNPKQWMMKKKCSELWITKTHLNDLSSPLPGVRNLWRLGHKREWCQKGLNQNKMSSKAVEAA